MEDNNIKEEAKEQPSCCSSNKKESKGFLSGLVYGLIPHTGCIAFIIFSILGVTTATALFKPLLMSRYLFYGLIMISFLFATISAIIYLKKMNMFSREGIKKKWRYLSVLYGLSIGINLLLFLIIFPIAANIASASPTGAAAADLSQITLKVDIPCPGHAPLISGELQTIEGVQGVRFRFPDYFDVSYDSKTSKEEILSLGVFNTYLAEASFSGAEEIREEVQPRGCSSCGSCSGACGGACSI